MTEQEKIYTRAKKDILFSKTLQELEVAKSFMNLSKNLVNITQWNDLTKNYFLKLRLLTENIEQ